MNIELREATNNDFEAICQLVTSEEELFYIYPKGQYPFTVEQLEQLAKVRTELTVAVKAKTIVGFANLYNYKPAHSAFIGNVVITSSHRGQNLGKQIVRYMLDKAFAKYKLPEVHISVFSENTPALLLYTGLGFTPYAIEERTNFAGKRVALLHLKITPAG